MAIHMGIKCNACGTVHFIATSPGVALSLEIDGTYRLTCKPTCSEMRFFRKGDMRPYRVTDELFNRGFAEPGEYELVEGGLFRIAS